MSEEALGKVRGPAIGIKVTAVIGAICAVLSLALNVLGIGGGMASGSGDEAMGMLMSGGVGIIMSLVGIGVAVFLWIAAGKLQRLENYNLCLVAAIAAMVPCISPCCIIGLPIGIWAIVVMSKADVKQAFTG